MLKTPLALLATGVLTAAGTAVPSGASAAPPKRLHASTVDGGARVLGAADATTLAVARADDSVILHRDDGGRTELPAPSGCGPSAVGSGLIAWDCPRRASDFQASTVVLTDLAGIERGRAPVPGGNRRTDAFAVGAQWVSYLMVPEKWPESFWINWHTGERKTYDTTQTAIWPDLDAPDLLAPYCPAVRADAVGGGLTPPGTRPVQFRPPWAIVDVRRGPSDPSNPVQHRVMRCGHGRAVNVPESLTISTTATLGDGWVAWTPRRGTGATHLMRLADRRRYVVGVRGSTTFTARRAWIGAPGGGRLSRVTFPRR